MPTLHYRGRFIDAGRVIPSDTQVRPGYVHIIGYAYAPTIVKWDGVYHLFCCSADYSGVGWDQTRHATSQDGITWSDPRIVLYTSDSVGERACCDPSLVYYNGYWYLFYSGNAKNVQTVMFVARADQIDGPFLKYTKRGTWEQNPPDPQVILGPVHPVPDSVPGWYGAGQQTVVVKDGTLYAWFTDDTLAYPDSRAGVLRFATSNDGITWSGPITAKNSDDGSDLQAGSVDVKYDQSNNRFVMFEIVDPHSEASYPVRRFSADGLNWSAPEVLCDPYFFPNYAHNIGASGDENGHLLTEGVILAYGAPHSDDVLSVFYTQDLSWASWDLHGHFLGGPEDDLRWGNRLPGFASDDHYFVGDFNGNKVDGNKVDDIARLHSGAHWFLVNGRNGAPLASPWWGYQIPGWPINGRYFVGDFDGDGAADIAFLSADAKWYIVNGQNGSPFPAPWWGYQIPGWPADGRYFVGDFNGDKASDIAFLSADARWYIVNGQNGSPFPAPWWGYQIPGWPADGRYFVGDFNGDKASDIAFLSADARWYIINGRNGAGFPAPWWGYQIPGWPADGRYFVGDFNGDANRADDIAFLRADAYWYIVNGQNGGPFPAPWWGYQIPGWPADGRYFVGDFDGDGAADIAFLSGDARWYIVNGRNGGPRGIEQAWLHWTRGGFLNPQRIKRRYLVGPESDKQSGEY